MDNVHNAASLLVSSLVVQVAEIASQEAHRAVQRAFIIVQVAESARQETHRAVQRAFIRAAPKAFIKAASQGTIASLGTIAGAVGPRLRGSEGPFRSDVQRLPGRPRETWRSKRTASELVALAEQFISFVALHPGLRIEQINRQLGSNTRDLALPIRKLLAEGRVRAKGRKRSTTYFAVGTKQRERRRSSSKRANRRANVRTGEPRQGHQHGSRQRARTRRGGGTT